MLEDDITTEARERRSNATLMYEVIDENTVNPIKYSTAQITPSQEEEYRTAEALFYNSYDPTLGYNTAAILGGLLLFILMYVFYRTKIRKPLIKFVKEKIRSWKNDSSLTGDKEENEEALIAEADDKLQSVGIKSFLSESENRDSLHSYTHRDYMLGDVTQNSADDAFKVPQVTITDESQDALPIVFMDTDDCTAEWVHKQHELLQPGGIIVKVKSDTICPPTTDLLEEGKCRKVCCPNPNCMFNRQISNCAHSQNALNLNRSIPMFDSDDLNVPYERLAKAKTRPKRPLLVNTKHHSLSSEPRSPVKRIPPLRAANHPSVSSEPKTPVSKINSNNFPMHITPIIKIQNTDKRGGHYVKGERRDSDSSSSSDDPLIYRITSEKWTRSRSPLRKSKTEDPGYTCCNHAPVIRPTKVKQLSVEEACHLGLLIPQTQKCVSNSPSCQSISQMETPL
ncbi:uncharacterized protein LOC133174119 [Saccostrea echinata]|uniref:uncharacterized protein LOC133174119 n=1 Tax=Saccostrea echinata TaxID=191078 RepID=UPI002A84156E|nr:uncharacterized protein LOC133174119 [Saccostrea echinata]